MKKTLTLFLTVILLLGVMQAPAMAADDSDTVHIISRNLGYATDNDNKILRAIEEATGLTIDWELWPTDNYATQCQLLIASGDMPDGMEIWWNSYPNDFITMIEDEIVQPLDEAIAGYENIQATRSAENYYDFGDGRIYGIPCRVLEDNSTYCVWLRQDWLDKLELDVPTTSDEYFEVLTAFQANAELLTGNADAFVAHGGANAYFTNCLYEYILSENGIMEGWNTVGDDLVYFAEMPGFKNALATVRKFYQAGLIDPETMLMNRDQFLDKWNQNFYGGVDFTTDIIDPNVTSWTKTFYEAVPNAELVLMAPFKDEEGVAHMRTVNQTIQFVAFSDSDKVDNLMKVLDFLATEEGMLLVQYGIQGEDWDYDENGEIVSYLTTDEERMNVGIGSYAWVYRRSYFASNFSSAFDADRAVIKASTVPSPILPSTETYRDVGTALGQTLKTFVANTIVTQDYDLDAEFDAFLKAWREQGGTQWTAEINDYWHARNAK